jgi:heat shock protein HtpX
MFIANPVHGKRFEYLIMNTHPPIKDRIKILRRLSGASYKDYQLAYSSVMRKRLISNRILNAEREMPLRQPLSPAPAESRIDIKRSIGDTLLAADDFIFLNCACGLKIKVPPQLDIRTIDCPRCGHRFAGSLKAT